MVGGSLLPGKSLCPGMAFFPAQVGGQEVHGRATFPPTPGLTASVCLCEGSLPTPHPPARSWSTLLTWDARAHFGSRRAVWLSELRPGASLGQEVGSREQASHCVHCEEPRASKGFYGVSSGTSSRERSCRHRRRGAALGEGSCVHAHALTHTGARVATRLAPRL